MFKYHAKEERWQNLVCTDFQHHATHFWLFVCLMCEKYCTKFIRYHSLIHRSQTQRRENVNVVVKSSEVIHRDIFLFSSLLKLKNIITKWNAATENICWAMMKSCWLLLWNLYHLSGSLKALRSIISWPGDGRLAISILRDTYSKFGQKLLEGVNTPSTSARYYQLRPNKSDWSPRISSNKNLSSSSNHECKILLCFDLVCFFFWHSVRCQSPQKTYLFSSIANSKWQICRLLTDNKRRNTLFLSVAITWNFPRKLSHWVRDIV